MPACQIDFPDCREQIQAAKFPRDSVPPAGQGMRICRSRPSSLPRLFPWKFESRATWMPGTAAPPAVRTTPVSCRPAAATSGVEFSWAASVPPKTAIKPSNIASQCRAPDCKPSRQHLSRPFTIPYKIRRFHSLSSNIHGAQACACTVANSLGEVLDARKIGWVTRRAAGGNFTSQLFHIGRKDSTSVPIRLNLATLRARWQP